MQLATLLLGLATSVVAAPASVFSGLPTVTKYVDSEATVYQWDEGWNKDFTIHSSCNDTQYNQIYAGLQEAKILAGHAKDHVLRFGNESEAFVKYFGNSSTAEVVGWFEQIVSSDKSGILFRCDNPDGNCENEGWAGHWRGENGTDETVICDLSYTTRLYLSQMCSQGYTVAGSKNTLFWASDLFHRIWHTGVAGQDVLGHYADSYEDCLTLAEEHPEQAVRNSNTLRFFSLEVYAYDVAVPGVGCAGSKPESSSSASSTASTSAPLSSASASATSANTSESVEADLTSTADESCHTHADGEVHCV